MKLGIFIILAVVFAGCVQFKPMALYENEDKIVEEPNIGGLYALDIYRDEANADLWGLEKTPFKNIKINHDKVYKGTGSLELFWDKSLDHTQWVGMGIGWDGWSGKDLEDIVDSAAIEMYVRAFNDEDTLKAAIIVFHLEDFSGIQTSAVFTDNKFLVDTAKVKLITKEWKKILIPLRAFDTQMHLINLAAVKQLLFQFEVNSHILLDEIKVVRYTPPKEEL